MSTTPDPPAAGNVPQGKMLRFFDAMTRNGASDLYIKPDRAPHLRINRVLKATRSAALTADEVRALAEEMLDEHHRTVLEHHGSVDLAFEMPGADRFRVNVYRQRGVPAVAVRRVTRDIPNFAALHMPELLGTIAEVHQGLVLISGPTGSGKSTTIASMLDYINQRRACHILTLEDPIEYVFEDKRAVISQREVGIDVPNFHTAQRDLMRQAPDVVLIGEMRDYETFKTALHAAETGHLVFGTVHASTASQTVSRVLELFPSDSRELIRHSLVNNLHAVVCQRLLPSVAKDLSVVPAVEIMISHPVVRKCIRDGREADLAEAIRSLERDGMISFTTSLLALIDQDLVAPDQAYEAAPNPEELRMLVRGINAGSGGFKK